MEINKIEICNLNSLKGEFPIDFMSGQLKGQDIFAITGATGSGKSTILDAITLALYNRIPRLDGKSGEADSKSEDPYKRLKPEDPKNSLSRGTKEGYAKVVFEVSGKIYRAEWICILKEKNFSGTHALYQIENESGVEKATCLVEGRLINEFYQSGPQSGKPKEGTVSQKVVELIGLGYDQFCKACILAQNSFANFLKADNYEKSDILEKITGTSIYGRIAEVITEGYDIAVKEKTDLENQISGQKKLLIEDEAKLAKDQADKKDLEKKKEELERELETIGKGLDWWTELERLQINLADAEKIKDKAVENERQLLPKREKLDRHDKLDKGLRLFDKETDAKRDLDNAENNVNDAKKRLNDNKVKIVDLGKDKASAEKDLEDKKSKMKRIDWAEPIKNNIAYICDEYKRLNKSVDDLRSAADEHSPESGYRTLGEKDLIQAIRRLTNSLGIELSSNIIQTDLDRIAGQLTLCDYADTLYGRMKQVQELDEQDKKDNETINSNSPLQKELKAEIEELEGHLKSLENKDLAYKRSLLVDGQPCELCGAIHHPYATASIFNEEIEKVKSGLKTKKEKKEGVDKNINDARDRISQSNGERIQLNANITELKAKIQDADDSFKTVFSNFSLDAQLQNLQSKANEKTALEENKTETERTLSLIGLRDLLDESNTHINHLNDYLPKGWYDKRVDDRIGYAKSLEEYVTKYIEADKDVSEAEKVVQTISTSIQTLEDLIPDLERDIEEQERRLDEKKSQSNNAVSELSEWITAFNAENDNPVTREELAAQMMDETDWENLRKEINTAENNRIACVTSYDNAYKSLKDHQEKKDRPSAGKDDLIRKEAATKELKDGVESELSAVSGRLTAHQMAEKAIAAFKGQRAEADREVKLWTSFYNMLGKNRNKGDKDAKEFRMLAQNYTLGLLLAYANIELRKFTSQRYLLKKQNDTSLEIMVVDGDLGERYASSLSGGETFMVSLALALGLSSISSGSVTIRNLFIDEGFGSLDNDTQGVVVGALNTLRTQGKRIGIISHTAALLNDDNIYKIRVTKNPKDDKFSVIDLL